MKNLIYLTLPIFALFWLITANTDRTWRTTLPRTLSVHQQAYIESNLWLPHVSPVHLETAFECAEICEVPVRLYFRLIQLESGWNHKAKNINSSAYGYGQILEGTGASLPQFNRFVPCDNLRMVAILLHRNYDNWCNRLGNVTPEIAWKYAVCEYGYGMGGMDKINSDEFKRYYFKIYSPHSQPVKK